MIKKIATVLVVLNYLCILTYLYGHFTRVSWEIFAIGLGMWGIPLLYILTSAILVLLYEYLNKVSRYLFVIYSFLLVGVVLYLATI